MKGIKRMLFGEKMPDKNDPQYKERYQREVKAGRKFAQTLKIDKAAAHVQRFADIHKTLFLVIVFGFVALSFGFNIYRMARVYNHGPEAQYLPSRDKIHLYAPDIREKVGIFTQ